MMKQGLQFKFSQQLSMTPQLQQAIKLLQLSSLELQQEVQQALDENPLLEVADQSAEGETDVAAAEESWEPSYSASLGSSGAAYDGEDTLYQGSTSESLQEHLLWQMRLSHFSPLDEAIATLLIDSIDERGYLTAELEELLPAIRQQHPELIQVELAEVAVVLKRIQHFDPIGVGARNVRECLLIQLRHLPNDTPYLNLALQAVEKHLPLLAQRDYRNLARRLRIQEADLSQVLALIQQLQPHPGDGFGAGDDDYVIPDVLVRKKNDRWTVELNSQSLPKLKVNEDYAALLQSGSQSEEQQYIRQHTQAAKWFIKSIESRNDTLLKVAATIVQRQQGFFEYGPEAMKPMVLADVANAVEMHESTISRITTQKYMHTPKGVFELKYFFSSQLATDNGEDASSTAIRAVLKKLVAAENPKKPLSDSKLTELMAEQGIQVARRTIAKYREAMNIPPSSQRKRLI